MMIKRAAKTFGLFEMVHSRKQRNRKVAIELATYRNFTMSILTF